MGLALAVVRIVEQPRDWRRWAVSGVVAGIGWWQSPQLVFVAAPLGAWMLLLVARRRLPLPPAGLLAFVAGTLAGGFPWFAFVARNGLLPLRAENAYGDGDGYVEHLVTFLREGAPMAFGARVVYEGRWVGGTTVGVAVAVVVGALVAVGVGRLLGTGLQQPAAIGGLVVLAYPLLLAAFPNGGYVGEGRYLFFLGPWLAFAVAALVPPSRVAAGGAAVAGCVALAAAGLAAPTPGLTSPYTNGAAVVPLHVSPVIEVLRDLGVRNVFTDYWIAMRLRYESDDDVLAASNLVFRDLQAQIDVDADPDAAWVVVAGSRDEARVRCAVTRLGLTATETPAAPFTVIRTDRPLRPGDVTPCPDEG